MLASGTLHGNSVIQLSMYCETFTTASLHWGREFCFLVMRPVTIFSLRPFSHVQSGVANSSQHAGPAPWLRAQIPAVLQRISKSCENYVRWHVRHVGATGKCSWTDHSSCSCDDLEKNNTEKSLCECSLKAELRCILISVLKFHLKSIPTESQIRGVSWSEWKHKQPCLGDKQQLFWVTFRASSFIKPVVLL